MRAAYGTLTEPVRLGIVPRLSIALVAVGVLVLAANFLVQRVVVIERTTQLVRTSPPQPRTRVPAAVRWRSVNPLQLQHALERYGSAALGRAEQDNAVTDQQLRRSASALRRAGRAFLIRAASIAGHPLPALSAEIGAYLSAGADLVKVADARRAALIKDSALLSAMTAQVQQPLNRAWRIFGRILARQSLLQLSDELDQLRRRSAGLASAKSAADPQVVALAASEQAVLDNLKRNERAFRRSQGDHWYRAMRTGLSGLVSQQQSVLELNQRLFEQSTRFAATGLTLAARIPVRFPAAAARPTVAAAHSRTRPPGGAAHRAAAGTEGPSAAMAGKSAASSPTDADSPTAALATVKSSSEVPEPSAGRSLISWISAGVLALLMYISMATILSIMRPVRRLIRASSRIARGETAVRVERGGIKELDALAIAFNAMAEELASAKAAARDYQQQLERQVAERTAQLQELARRDPLTGLPNRREFLSMLTAAIDRAGPEGGLVGVLFLDVDNFKYINDGMGHGFGDRVLVSLAQRLLQVTRDLGFAARIGGDEFIVVCEGATDVAQIHDGALEIVRSFQRPLSVGARELIVSVSVGAAVYPEHEQDAAALLRAADAALFRAKALGRSQLSVFTPELVQAAAAKFSTEQGLRRAIERGEFELHYQPEVSAQTRQTVLVEALIRWRTPDGALVSPDRFLAISEDSGLIMQISDWVLETAIAAAAHWHHGAWPGVRVAINVSPRQILDHRFAERLQSLLRQHRLPTQCIEIELTESVLQTGAPTIDALRRLRAEGVAIALDDFGTGYSSLASLEALPITRVKLDHSLIARIDRSARSEAIARAIIAMCEGLELEITAEGVERPEQFTMLLAHDRMYLQGYLLSAPVSAEELLPCLRQVARRAEELAAAALLVRASEGGARPVVSKSSQTPKPGHCRASYAEPPERAHEAGGAEDSLQREQPNQSGRAAGTQRAALRPAVDSADAVSL